MVELLYRDDAYLRSVSSTLLDKTDDNGLIFDKSIFYPNSGGQPGDSGLIRWGQDQICRIETTIKTKDGKVVLIPKSQEVVPRIGLICQQDLDWEKRYLHMRMHTALHLLSVVIPLPVTGGQITDKKGRLDFNMPEPIKNKEELEGILNELISNDYLVSVDWITDNDLERNPSLVKTMSVKPPTGQGKVRLVKIGNEIETIDLQPCGGTHVRSTSEIGQIFFGKVEKKGKNNRRVSIFLSA